MAGACTGPHVFAVDKALERSTARRDRGLQRASRGTRRPTASSRACARKSRRSAPVRALRRGTSSSIFRPPGTALPSTPTP